LRLKRVDELFLLPHTGGTKGGLRNMDIKDRVQICKVVAQAILVDAQITDSERELLETLMNKYELSEDQKREVLARNIGDDPVAMVREINGVEPINELIVELALAVAVDGEVSSSEMALMAKIAQIFDITPAELDLMLKAALS
jgi:tellurite resistance protein